MERPLCKCHGEPMVLSGREKNGTIRWRCQRSRAATYARYLLKPKTKPKRRATNNVYWHRADGGYIKRRKRHLKSQRQRLLHQLEVLHAEPRHEE